MSISRFFVTFTIIIGIFLFVFGAGTLYYINNVEGLPIFANDNNKPDGDTNNNNNPGGIGDLLTESQYPVNFLLFVGDYDETNTDFIALVNYNPDKKEFSFLSIPRDTRVPGVDIQFPKVNSLYFRSNGQELAVEAISTMLKVNVKYYIYTNLKTFRDIIDLLGGVVIDVPVDMDYDDPTQNLHIHIEKGIQNLDGRKSEEYLRFRKPNNDNYTPELLKHYNGSDLSRIKAQQNYMRELVKQKANLFTLTKINQILETIFNNLKTNATMNDILTLVKSVPTLSLDKVNFYTLPGVAEQGSLYYEMDEQKTGDIISAHFYSRGNVSFNEDPNERGAG